jgi:hypothetical protein
MAGGRDDFDAVDGLPEDPLLSHPSHDAGAAHIPDHIVDRFFDRELTRREASGLFDSFRADPASARRFVQTQRMLDALKEPVRTPDFTRSILSRIDQASPEAPLLTRRGVRQVRVGRLAAAAALVMLVGGAFVVQRLNPNVVEFGVQPETPLGSLRSNMTGDATDAMNTLRQTARAIESTASSSVLAGVSAETGRTIQFTAPGSAPTMATIRARFLPEIVFPWRQRSVSPSTETVKSVAWVVPCGSAPCSSASRGDGLNTTGSEGLIFVDLTGLSNDSTGRTGGTSGASGTSGRRATDGR